MSDVCRIRVLSDLLVNKIAAGEVVERPAAVVKELIDNSIDAGATRISVAIEDGGKQLVRVTDDGRGMSADDLRLAVMPHATSKIAGEDDLYSIATMGFRGEALASISAVSKLRIVSRPLEAIEGHEVRIAGKRFESSGAAGCPPGTSAEVRDLFFNVPARRKFLRARSTEVGHINEQVARAALAFPPLSFELTNNGRVTQNLPPCTSRLERIAGFYGEELAAALLTVERSERGITLEAYLAPPSQSRATTQWQYTFVNGRYIRDRYVQHAVKEAYRGLMDPNRQGVVFLFLTIDPHDVDVNVHPTKIEVRWADSNLIHSQVLSALRETFQRSDLTPALQTDGGGLTRTSETRTTSPVEQDRIRREMAAALKTATPIQPGAGGGQPHCEPTDKRPDSTPSGGRGLTDRPGSPTSTLAPEKMWQALYGTPDSSSPTRASEEHVDYRLPPDDAAGAAVHSRAIQLHNLYLVAETEDGIIIIDQHALHERIMYEQLRERITKGRLESQRLLLPETLSITPQQVALIESNEELLRRLGLEVTRFGSDAIAVHAFPALLKDTDVVSFMRDLLDHLAQQAANTQTEEVLHTLLDMMACKAAIKAGDPLTGDEIDALMRQRHLVEKPSSCPHGRPTTLHLSKADLNRQFKRT